MVFYSSYHVPQHFPLTSLPTGSIWRSMLRLQVQNPNRNGDDVRLCWNVFRRPVNWLGSEASAGLESSDTKGIIPDPMVRFLFFLAV